MLKASKIKNIYLSIGLLVALGAGIFAYNTINEANAQVAGGGINPGNGGGNGAAVPLVPGDVYGWAWTGQNIVLGSDESEGGGGWLNLNCKPNDCGPNGPNGDWGTQIQLVHNDDYGLFMGQGWSSYYGWLSFEYDDVQSCWEDNSFVVEQTPARAMLNDAGPWVNVIGWGKFIAGDVDDDGWDGCVSFNGVNHDVEVNKTTGILRGWAWGGSVTGWVSFTNPECPFCNTGVVLEGSTSIAFWADDTTDPAGGATTLRWQATNTAPNFVSECSAYNNTSNYTHWRSTGIGANNNVGLINTGNGKLPSGSHPISGIAQTTTYSLSCEDRYGTDLPTQYVTITRGAGICTDPTAQNQGSPLPCIYDAGMCADIDANNFGQALPCTYDPVDSDPATIVLDVDRPIIYENESNFNVLLDWYSADDLDSCVGSFAIGGTTTALSGWTGNKNPPDITGFTGQNNAFSNLLSISTPPQTYTFRITCQDEDNNSVTDTATVNFLPYVPSFEAPDVDLKIIDPNVQPPGFQREDIAPSILAAPANITLEWRALNVHGCNATSGIYNASGTGNPVSTNTDWDGSKSDEGTYTDILDMTNASVRMPTKFFITCIADDPGITTPITREVCLGLANTSFPACSVTGTGNVPSYQEI